MIDLMLPGGEMKIGIDPLEGAKQWIEKYYPNLVFESIILRADLNMPIPMLDENTLDNLISEKESKNKDDGVAKYLKDMKIRIKGQNTEINTIDMLLISLEDTKPQIPIVILSNIEWRTYRGLFSPGNGEDQEIDNVMILGEYSRVVLLEIKSSHSFSPTMAKSLNRKKEI